MLEDPIGPHLARWNVARGENFEKDTVLETDFCIIGSGAGGAVAAAMLSAKGHRVTIIEEGLFKYQKDFHMLESEAYPDLYQESGARKTKDHAIQIFQGRSVGGSTTVNWATCFRTPEMTLRHWETHFGVKGIETETLSPWFERVEKEFSIIPWEVTPNANNLMLARGLESLGIKWQSIKRNVKGCRNLGYCGVGCPVNAKQSTLVTKIPEALDAGAQLISEIKALKFQFKGDQISELICVPMVKNVEKKIKVFLRAKHYILAAGSIGSPALLLRSEAPDPHKLIGKRTFIHPVNVSAGLSEEAIFANSGAPQSVYTDHFLENNPATDPVGFKIETAPMLPILLSQVVRGHGDAHFDLMAQFPYISNMIALMRDGFHEESPGGEVHLRSDGSPVLDYQVPPYLWEGFKRAWLQMAEIQFAAGAKFVLPIHSSSQGFSKWSDAKREIPNLPSELFAAKLFSAHVMGGLPFGEDSKKSVLDSFGKFRNLENLTVVDGSMFPTSIGANPQESIFVFSYRNTDALLHRI